MPCRLQKTITSWLPAANPHDSDNDILNAKFLFSGKSANRIQNIEKIRLGKRMRHFGTKLNGDIFFDDNSFFVSTDDLTILEIKFLNFR